MKVTDKKDSRLTSEGVFFFFKSQTLYNPAVYERLKNNFNYNKNKNNFFFYFPCVFVLNSVVIKAGSIF